MERQEDKHDLQTPVERKRLTPIDIQQAVFRRALFRGYREEEVDQLLDLVTEELALLLEEQRRLREQIAGAAAQPVATSEATAAELAPFLSRERAFLRELAQLVQNHAESLKGMVAAARERSATPEPPAPPAQAEETEEAESAPAPVVEEADSSQTVVLDEVENESEATVGQSSGGERSLKELFWGED